MIHRQIGKPRVWVAETESYLRRSIQYVLERSGYPVVLREGVLPFLEQVRAGDEGIVIAGVPTLKEGSGAFFETIHRRGFRGDCILLTEEVNEAEGVEAIRMGVFDYLGKPFDVERLAFVISRAAEKRQLAAEVRSLEGDVLSHLERVVAVLEERDPYLAGHSERVRTCAVRVGRALSLSQGEIKNIDLAGLVHDVGTLGQPIVVGKGLSPKEWAQIRRHPEVGAEILGGNPIFHEVLQLVLTHHEHHDGSGYPHKLRGEAIPLGGRILGLAEVFVAMTSPRSYRLEESETRGKEEILAQGWFDPQVVDAFLRAFPSG
jgi:HD-GYP domain-containing protein (c-di-GMP phosphodiesterase class II)